ncbi:hypothetical protein [Desulforhopalus sp. IMCC35007]|uniref:hypothetical protein n=1 Tax=Desulforhopalus sp. IMCC35007 TaxID=2569543 RepID=UPI0010AE9A1B|nr:hypothetical protein [Desulforhopalus sp. IMCC35007]TKB05885.1 hypothetical protein FCL48_23185 [Desulforhopalus sp. IMCC35007]
MNTETIDAIVEYLKQMAANFTASDSAGLRGMKQGLDEYVEKVSSQIPEQSRSVTNREFEKCRRCAHDWIKVYTDSAFHPGDRTDILREEAMEFFFSVEEKIVAVQKKFFLLGMIDELLTPGTPLSQKERDAKVAKSRIRILAREQGVTTSCKDTNEQTPDGMVTRRLWFFGDERNFLQSSEVGLNDQEALDYLLQ